jgi:hypothetical protein
LRQPILYAEIQWRRQRIWPFLFMLLGLVLAGMYTYQNHLRFDLAQSGVFLLYIPFGLLVLGFLLYYRRRNYVEVTEQGVRVSGILSRTLIPYELIRNVRVQPLERHFQDDRKRLARPINRELLPRPALFLRLKGPEEQVQPIRRKLGRQLASPDAVAIPVPDPDALSWEIGSRLPERTGTNLGGRRRRRRGR